MAQKTKKASKRQLKLFLVVAGFSLLFFVIGVMLTAFVVNMMSRDSALFSNAGGDISVYKEVETQRQRDKERQQLYVDYNQPASAPTVASDAEKQRMSELFDKAFRPELTSCQNGALSQQVNYGVYRKINQYANRVVARDCYSRDYMFFVNRAGEWQQSGVNIVQEFASARSWLSACYLDDILPARDTQPESSKYIGETNQIECEYIAKYEVSMTNDQINKAYEEKYGGE